MRKLCLSLAFIAIAFTVISLRAGEDYSNFARNHIKEHLEHLNRMADEANREGNFKEAAELRKQAENYLKEETEKITRVESLISEKNIAKDIDILLLSKSKNEFIVGEFLTYLEAVNLVNGLNLTGQQLKQILRCLEKKMVIANDKEWKRALAGYLLVKDGLEKDGHMTEQTKDIFFYSESLHMHLMHKTGENHDKDMMKLISEVESILSDAQKEIIRTFVPCHIPTDDQENPVRVGQAETADDQLRLLEDARNIPKREYEEWFNTVVIPRIESKIKSWSKHPGYDCNLNLKEETKRISAILDKAKNFEDVEFELEKYKLAAELLLTPDPPQGEIDEAGVTERIEVFLMDERLLPLIRKRIAKK